VSNLDPAPEAIALAPGVVRAVDVLEARKAAIGDGAEVRRLLPQRTLRTVGAWCFLDHYGPDDVSIGPGMQVPPHPHIGLQTVSSQAREDWVAGRFGKVHGYPGEPLAAPPVPSVPLKPR
jgi:Pirin